MQERQETNNPETKTAWRQAGSEKTVKTQET